MRGNVPQAVLVLIALGLPACGATAMEPLNLSGDLGPLAALEPVLTERCAKRTPIGDGAVPYSADPDLDRDLGVPARQALLTLYCTDRLTGTVVSIFYHQAPGQPSTAMVLGIAIYKSAGAGSAREGLHLVRAFLGPVLTLEQRDGVQRMAERVQPRLGQSVVTFRGLGFRFWLRDDAPETPGPGGIRNLEIRRLHYYNRADYLHGEWRP